MFLFKRKESSVQEGEKQNVPVSNPFQNIQKNSLDEKQQNDLQNGENINGTGEDEQKDVVTTEKGKVGAASGGSAVASGGSAVASSGSGDKGNTIDNRSGEEEGPANFGQKGKGNVQVNVGKFQGGKKTLHLYSSEEEASDKDDAQEGEKMPRESLQHVGRKMFANVSNDYDKLVFLTKRAREENKRKLEMKDEAEASKREEKYRSDSHRKNREENKMDANDSRHKYKRRAEYARDEGRTSGDGEKGSLVKTADIRGHPREECEIPEMWKKGESSLAELNMLHLSTIENDNFKEKEMEIIKQHYLGLNKKKKKMQKPSEKFRNIFNFEWDQSEDTAKNDSNPLYQNRLEPQLLFGRGYIAGIDIREQRKRNNFYDKLVQNRINISMKKSTDSYKSKRDNVDVVEFIDSNVPSSSGVTPHNGEFIYEPKVNNIIKDVQNKHWSEKKREEMTDRDWRIFREDNEIYIKGGVVPPPIRKWEESKLSVDLLKAIKKAKYEKPTPIQMQAIPIALEMRDLIGIAETGSGKTAAFVLPMLSYVKQLPPLTYETSQDGPYALIIAPSRELAIQIYEETNKFASYCSCRTVAVVGGRNAESQAFELRRGVEIVIGTPGRLQDCLEKAYTVLNQCNYVVIDEADRMMDMGFEDTVHFILDQIPTTNLKSEDDALALQEEMMTKAGHRLYRLTQMFSATMPPSVERLSRKYLRAPAYISIGDPGAGKRSIEQKLEFITEGKKKQKLQEILEVYEPPIIVFVNQKKVADIIAKSISKMKFKAVALHGGKAQEIREQTLNSFKNGDFDILVATDVAGRGIDVHGVKLVINFDLPKDIESYTHRIGRTGRAGMKGLAISFVTEHDTHLFYDLKQFLISSNNIVPLELANNPASKVKPGTITQTPKKKQILYKN
ncbi:ATP-dependent RNA helicase DDX23, putative (DDX23) [Plasmodium ovale wallikeri]|uniref:RNA helicase n=1 Tax=Plasmodium ovale wallikeri TaxID=864142 RepID=A0A1A8YY47_PLAOA|nr:ATP-dependent RNA helicase DDX23, putative (DDX23) [Plasmodium ovale wallikeri]SBT36641.1 ATP-dependent RNA helicase DDX23, putative (DDX23) [Plasmodium ovale wallikeri]